MTKQNNLKDRLAKSLDKSNTQKDIIHPSIEAPRSMGGAQKCKKISISLFHTDLVKLNGIRSYMETHGQHISASQAIKLALRTAPLSNELLTALATIQAEDGRTTKPQ